MRAVTRSRSWSSVCSGTGAEAEGMALPPGSRPVSGAAAAVVVGGKVMVVIRSLFLWGGPADGIAGRHLRSSEVACRGACSDPEQFEAVGDQVGDTLGGAFEDTAHGVAAAQAAGLRCVAVPNPHADHGRFIKADVLLPSAANLTLDAVLAALTRRP